MKGGAVCSISVPSPPLSVPGVKRKKLLSEEEKNTQGKQWRKSQIVEPLWPPIIKENRKKAAQLQEIQKLSGTATAAKRRRCDVDSPQPCSSTTSSATPKVSKRIRSPKPSTSHVGTSAAKRRTCEAVCQTEWSEASTSPAQLPSPSPQASGSQRKLFHLMANSAEKRKICITTPYTEYQLAYIQRNVLHEIKDPHEMHRCLIYTSSSFSTIGNVFLIYLIINHTHVRLGAYRYLLIVFSAFGIFHACLQVLVSPLLHVQGNIYIAIYDGVFIKHLDRQTQHHLTIVYCSLFLQYMMLVVYHFTYRYIAICKVNTVHILHRPKIIVLCVFVYIVTLGVFHAVCSDFLPITAVKDAYVDSRFWELYNSSIYEHGYIGPLYKTLDDEWDLRELGASLVILTLIILCMIAVALATMVIYKLTYRGTSSHQTRTLHTQLFRVQMVQCAIPFITAYCPAISLFVLPIFGWNYDLNIGFYISIACSTFPAVESIAIIYIFKDYRQATKKLLLTSLGSHSSRIHTLTS